MDPLKAHYISVTGIVIKNGKFLIVRRSLDEKNYPGRWIVPGGKLSKEDYVDLEKNKDGLWYEVLESVLRREIKEETGLEIGNIKYLTNMTFMRSDGIPGLIISFFCDWKEGEIKLSDELIEHAWVNIEKAREYDLIDGMLTELELVNNILNLS